MYLRSGRAVGAIQGVMAAQGAQGAVNPADTTLRDAVKTSLPLPLKDWPRPAALLRWLQHLRSALRLGPALPDAWKVAQILSLLPDRHGIPVDYSQITCDNLIALIQRDHCPAHPATVVWQDYLEHFSTRPSGQSPLEYVMELTQILRDLAAYDCVLPDAAGLAMFSAGIDFRPVSSFLAQHNVTSLAEVHAALMTTDLYAVRPPSRASGQQQKRFAAPAHSSSSSSYQGSSPRYDDRPRRYDDRPRREDRYSDSKQTRAYPQQDRTSDHQSQRVRFDDRASRGGERESHTVSRTNRTSQATVGRPPAVLTIRVVAPGPVVSLDVVNSNIDNVTPVVLTALIDTGAEASLVKQSTLISNGLVPVPLEAQGSAPVAFAAANGGSLRACGTIGVRSDFLPEDSSLFVLPGLDSELQADALLGRDLVSSLVWNSSSGQLVVNGVVVQDSDTADGFDPHSGYVHPPPVDPEQVDVSQSEMVEWVNVRFPIVADAGLGRLDPAIMSCSLTLSQSSRVVPIFCRPRPLNGERLAQARRCVEELLTQGIIVESTSAWSFPVVLVPKVGGGIRLCVDFRQLNNLLEPVQFPLPTIADTRLFLTGAALFSHLDMSQAYHQICMSADSAELVSFCIPGGHYQYSRMPFGLSCAPSIFQLAMTRLLAPLLGKTVLLYLDDILVFSGPNPDDHRQALVEVLSILQDAGLRLNLSKCIFGSKCLKYLGFVWSSAGVHSDPAKVKVVQEWPTPRTVKALRRFLGFAGFQRSLVPQFASIAAPLFDACVESNLKLTWTAELQHHFVLLKQAIASACSLFYPVWDWSMQLRCDASITAVAGVLLQVSPEGERQPLFFFSRKLSVAERKWSTLELELFAIVSSVQAMEIYVTSAAQPVTVCTDHANLVWLLKHSAKGKVGRWYLYLQQFNLIWKHVSGVSLADADALSRMDQAEQEVAAPASGSVAALRRRRRVALPPAAEATTIDGSSFSAVSSLERLKRAQHLELASEVWSSAGDDPSSVIVEDVLYRKAPSQDRFVPVVPPSLVPDFLRAAHDLVGHPGRDRTLQVLRTFASVPGDAKLVAGFVAACATCASIKPAEPVHQGEMIVFEAKGFNDVVGVDLVGPLPEDAGFVYICSIVDKFSRYPLYVPIKSASAEDAADAVLQWISLFSVPNSLLTDRGTNFVSELFELLCKRLGVTHLRTAPGHPQSNGSTERSHATLIRILKSLLDPQHPDRWVKYLPSVMLFMRSMVCAATGLTPYRVVFGRDPVLPVDLLSIPAHRAQQDLSDYNLSLTQDIQIAEKLVRGAQHRASLASKSRHDEDHVPVEFPVGSYVWLHDRAVTKLQRSWSGPYKVLKIVSPVTVQLEVAGIHHVSRLRAAIMSDKLFAQLPSTPPQAGQSSAEDEELILCHSCHYGADTSDPFIVCSFCGVRFHKKCARVQGKKKSWLCFDCRESAGMD